MSYEYLDHAVKISSNFPKGEKDGSHLSDLEREWLQRIPSSGWELASSEVIDWSVDERTPGQKAADWTAARISHETSVIVWRGEFGLALGVVRCRRPAGQYGWDEDVFEASPFPGAWETVRISDVLLVRHAATI